MFTRDIEVDGQGTLNIHYVHKKSEVENAVPLLFVHGWPGSFFEVRKILPLLVAPSTPDAPAFHVVAVGLPGFGFSEQPHKRGFGPTQMAETAHKLMLALGYNEYVTQGGDWGSLITRIISNLYGKEHAKAWHTNAPFSGRPSLFRNPIRFLLLLVTPFSSAERAGMKRGQETFKTGWGYFLEQSTQPQTLSYSLADSPVGLLAWIYEKLIAWTDEYPWNDDEILTWISIYWFSRAGPGASTRIYYEYRIQEQELSKLAAVSIPTGISNFPKELFRVPDTWVRTIGNVVQITDHDRGGHFAAHEVPELLVSDLRKMFGRGGPAFGVVPGKTGYSA